MYRSRVCVRNVAGSSWGSVACLVPSVRSHPIGTASPEPTLRSDIAMYMLPSTTSTTAWLPSTVAQWLSIHRIFWIGSLSRDVTSTGRRLARYAASEIRAARFAERTAANVAKASTSVPTAVPRVATVDQSKDASTTGRSTASRSRRHRAALPHPARDRGWQTRPTLAHVSIQCADFDRSATFYDAVLAPLGGSRVMEVDDAIGYGVPPAADFWIGRQQTGDGFRETHVAFSHRTAPPSTRSSRPPDAPAPRSCTSRGSGPSTTRRITAGSSATPTATTSRPSALSRVDDAARHPDPSGGT